MKVCLTCQANLFETPADGCPHCGGTTFAVRVDDTLPITLDESNDRPWRAASFAREWYKDALREASIGADPAARRREIIFAVCFAESYLFEWVRDDVLGRNYAPLKEYFSIHTCIAGPSQKNTGRASRRSVLEKWKCIPKKLAKDHRITAAPDYSRRYWQDFSRLVDYRNGLAHARASRPYTDGLAEKEQPSPKPADLDTLPPGWAVTTVLTLICEVHQAASTRQPLWDAAAAARHDGDLAAQSYAVRFHGQPPRPTFPQPLGYRTRL